MKRREPFSWRDRFPDQITCVRCLEVKEARRLDRLLWCEECQEAAKARAARLGWGGGVIVSAVLIGYIFTMVRPSDLIIQLWIAAVVASLWLGARFSRELIYGAMRFQNRRAAEAVPPAGGEPPTESGSEPGAGPGSPSA